MEAWKLRCTECGSDKLFPHGYEIVDGYTRHRYVCIVCGTIIYNFDEDEVAH